MNTIYPLTLPTLLTGLLFSSSALAAPPGAVPFGVYDPEGSFTADPEVSIEHVFLPWDGVDLDTLYTADAYAQARDRSLLVTVEPWVWGEAQPSGDLRDDILSGRRDGTMRAICVVLNDLQSPVTLRWAQEMENSQGHFPWSKWQPAEFIEAHRRMIDICRAEAPDLRVMWSPAGEDGLQDYYPGDDMVDVIGLSVFGAQDFELAHLGGAQSFTDILGPRYDRAIGFGKPIVVAELGFVGDDGYADSWYQTVRQPDPRFAALEAVVYFNRQEVWPWPFDFGLPDWRESAQQNE